MIVLILNPLLKLNYLFSSWKLGWSMITSFDWFLAFQLSQQNASLLKGKKSELLAIEDFRSSVDTYQSSSRQLHFYSKYLENSVCRFPTSAWLLFLAGLHPSFSFHISFYGRQVNDFLFRAVRIQITEEPLLLFWYRLWFSLQLVY